MKSFMLFPTPSEGLPTVVSCEWMELGVPHDQTTQWLANHHLLEGASQFDDLAPLEVKVDDVHWVFTGDVIGGWYLLYHGFSPVQEYLFVQSSRTVLADPEWFGRGGQGIHVTYDAKEPEARPYLPGHRSSVAMAMHAYAAAMDFAFKDTAAGSAES